MLRFRVASDIHNEFGKLILPKTANEQDSILLLAGDICNATKRMTFTGFFQEMCERFRAVVYIFGNHEFYDGSIDTARSSFIRRLELDCKDLGTFYPDNLHILENQTIDFDDVRIIGATLWTSFRNGNPIIMNEARTYMNDYALIRTGGKDGYDRLLRPEDIFEKWWESDRYIWDQLDIARKDGKKVVFLTHHAPCQASCEGFYGESNEFYANHYEYRLEQNGPDLIVHGHVHMKRDYVVGKTRVVCNPRGYKGHEEMTGFDPLFELEL